MAWFALAMLVFNLAAGSAQSMPAAAGSAQVICTSHGMITLGEDGKPVSSESGWGHLCVFCLPLLHGAAATASPVAIPVPAVYPVESRLPAGEEPAPAPFRPLGEACPRAPPSQA